MALGVFVHYRAPRMGRNPKTGEKVSLRGKHVPHFKPGKELRERVNIDAPRGSHKRFNRFDWDIESSCQENYH